MSEKLKAVEMTEKKLKELFQEMDRQIEVIERGLEKVNKTIERANNGRIN